MLFSHLHWDHVQGFPFFTPAYLPTTELTLYGPGDGGDRRCSTRARKQMQPPNFPVPLVHHAREDDVRLGAARPHAARWARSR